MRYGDDFNETTTTYANDRQEADGRLGEYIQRSKTRVKISTRKTIQLTNN